MEELLKDSNYPRSKIVKHSCRPWILIAAFLTWSAYTIVVLQVDSIRQLILY